MPLPSRKQLTAQLQSVLGTLLEEYALEGKKNRKLADKAAGKLAKALKKNADKQELKKAPPVTDNGAEPKKAKKLKKGAGKEEKADPATGAAAPVAGKKAGKKEKSPKKPDLVNA